MPPLFLKKIDPLAGLTGQLLRFGSTGNARYQCFPGEENRFLSRSYHPQRSSGIPFIRSDPLTDISTPPEGDPCPASMGTDLVCPRSVRASNNETGKVNPHRYHAIPKIFLQQSKRFCIAIYERDSGAISEHCRYAAKLDAGYTSDNNGGFTFLCWIDLTPVNR